METGPDSGAVTVGAPMLPDPARLAGLIAEAVATGWFANGGMLHHRLERALAEDHAGPGRRLTLVSSGTMALMLALRLGNLPEGAEVITSPLSFAATAQAIAWCGFRPVFADVEPQTLTLCPRAVEAAITPRTAAILPVHFLGQSCDAEALGQVAARHGLWLVYDAAHAIGVSRQDRPIGDFGDVSAFSLHATKGFHTGEGGFLVTPDGAMARAVRHLRNFGLEGGQPTGLGINGKMSELQAAMGLALLPDLSAELAAREALRRVYDVGLAGLEGVAVPRPRAGSTPGLTMYALRLRPDLRARVHAALLVERIMARDHFPLLCGPGTPWPEGRIVTFGGPPRAPELGPEVLVLPFHGRVGPAAERIIAVIRRLALG